MVNRCRNHLSRRASRGRQARGWRTAGPAAIILALTATLASSAAGIAESRNSGSTINGSFADSCRDFAAHSSKDISHVEIHYADGRVFKDESTTGPDYAIDGGAGDEIQTAIVKSGTTTDTFACRREGSPPTAVLEIKTPTIDDPNAAGCSSTFGPPDLYCHLSLPRSAWTRWEPGQLYWFFCAESFSFGFRGTSSTDPDGDIVSWSIDFGDETSTSGNWATDPPSEVAHDYGYSPGPPAQEVVTLSVTDATGQSDSDTLPFGFVFACND